MKKTQGKEHRESTDVKRVRERERIEKSKKRLEKE